ncbi:MAG: BolA family protein [Burkholderiaceae bacterium]|nr:BolA family protein [Burkholderiaceae bacterium]
MNTTNHLQITSANLRRRLQEKLQPTHLDVLDESSAHAGHAGSNGTDFGTHFRVRIASPFFTNMSRVASHRLVYDAVQDFIDRGLHALAIEIVSSTPSNQSATVHVDLDKQLT